MKFWASSFYLYILLLSKSLLLLKSPVFKWGTEKLSLLSKISELTAEEGFWGPSLPESVLHSLNHKAILPFKMCFELFPFSGPLHMLFLLLRLPFPTFFLTAYPWNFSWYVTSEWGFVWLCPQIKQALFSAFLHSIAFSHENWKFLTNYKLCEAGDCLFHQPLVLCLVQWLF